MQEFARDVIRGNIHMRTTDLTFSDIPHQSRLFLDHLSDPDSLRQYYPNAQAGPRVGVASFADEVLRAYPAHREEVCDALVEINRAADAGEQTFENIKRLRSPNCVAVLTGQQAGLFSGPLYTVYKALSAIRLAADLTEAGTEAVPVFWAATEDHDIDEVSTTFVPGEVRFKAPADQEACPVGAVPVPNRDELIASLFDQLTRTEYTDDLRRIVDDSYSEGSTLGSAFLKLLAKLFADYGLIFIDPMNPSVRALSAPIMTEAIKKGSEIGSRLLNRSHELTSSGYSSQVAIEEDHFPMFWIDEKGSRRALRRDEGGFRAKGSRTTFSQDELLTVAAENPERLSPAVMLRPVVQDYLLPTVAYFGGAAEVAYFAQNSVVYEALGRPVTPIFHRQSFTVVEPRSRRTLEKFGLTLADLFRGKDAIMLEAAAELDAEGTGMLFASAEERINTELNRLDQKLSALDVTVAANLATRRKKIIYHLGALKKKALLATLRRDETAERQIADLFACLMPNGVLQERSLNVLYFLNKYGPGFIDWIYAATDVDERSHRVVDL